MKLKELLKHHNIVWPEGATHAVQDCDREIKFASSSNIKLYESTWFGGDVIDVAEVFDLPLASDWDTAIVAKQNWIQITKEQIKSIPVGSPIRVGGTETILSYHYIEPSDYGFNTKHIVQDLGGSTFGSSDWNKNIKVEVLMNQGHPHAELMLQYAQDAKTHTEPWDLYQIKTVQNIWKDIGCQFIFDSNCTYRRKPKTHTVNGVEIPDLRFTPKTYEEYYFPSPNHPSLAFRTRANYAHFNAADEHRIKNGLCYEISEEGRQAAKLHSKAMIGIAT